MVNPVGKNGENLAVAYLQKKGYLILERNYRSPCGEIDIICAHRGQLIFVEVKTRRSTSFGMPEEAVTRRKQEHIKKAALCYMANLQQPYRTIRFDVIAILLQTTSIINHIEAAF